jgi:hypothetical protein
MKKITITRSKFLIAVLWPSFVFAGIFTGLFFAFFDPYVLLDELGLAFDSRVAGYSITFLVSWLLGILAASMAIYILCTPDPKSGTGTEPT